MGPRGNPSCNYNGTQTRFWDQNMWYSLHIYNSLCTEQLSTSRYQLPNQEPWKGTAKGLVAELAPPRAQSAWRCREEMIRAAGLATCCNYFLKKKKKMKGYGVIAL